MVLIDSPENYETKSLNQNPLLLWIYMYLNFSVSKTPYQEQAITRVYLHFQIFTKWYQQSSTLNATFEVMKQAILIGCRSTEFHKQMKPVNYKGTMSPSQISTDQVAEQFFISIISICFLVGKYLVITDLLEYCYTKNVLTSNYRDWYMKDDIILKQFGQNKDNQKYDYGVRFVIRNFFRCWCKTPQQWKNNTLIPSTLSKISNKSVCIYTPFCWPCIYILGILISYFSSVEISCRDRSQNNQIMNLMTLNDKNFKYK